MSKAFYNIHDYSVAFLSPEKLKCYVSVYPSVIGMCVCMRVFVCVWGGGGGVRALYVTT